MYLAIQLAERRLLNDTLIRKGIRKLLAERLKQTTSNPRSSEDWIQTLQANPLAEKTDAANAQHYEIPPAYFKTVLGPYLKYSSGYWPDNCQSLEEAEATMLQLTCERAELEDGQDILELGCGWGSLSLWMAEQYPKSSITSVSNSNSQREYINARIKERGITNLKLVTSDINIYKPEQRFDRIVSVEMFEHIRNHRMLLHRIHSWLKENGKLFIHIFTHRSLTYLFETNSAKDWMSTYFFTGGIMPSVDLLPTAAQDFTEEARWSVNGTHYSKTLEAWLDKQDTNEAIVRSIFRSTYGKDTERWIQRWRMFYMACSELFAYKNGTEWFVMHYRFKKSP